MATFKDGEGRDWNVRIDVAAVKLVRSELNVDLTDLGDTSVPEKDRLIYRLSTDPVLLVDTLYLICRDQAEQRGVSEEQFGRMMCGDVIDHATKALLNGIVDFFRNPRDRARARKILEAMDRLADAAGDKLDREVEAAIRQAEASFAQSTGSPGPSESTPTP